MQRLPAVMFTWKQVISEEAEAEPGATTAELWRRMTARVRIVIFLCHKTTQWYTQLHNFYRTQAVAASHITQSDVYHDKHTTGTATKCNPGEVTALDVLYPIF